MAQVGRELDVGSRFVPMADMGRVCSAENANAHAALATNVDAGRATGVEAPHPTGNTGGGFECLRASCC
jgi:hypothetical protein